MIDLTGHVIECRTYLRGAAMPDAPITEVAALMLVKEKERARLVRSTKDELKKRFRSRHDDGQWAKVSMSIINKLGEEMKLWVNRREPLINHFVWYARYIRLKINKACRQEKYQFAYAEKSSSSRGMATDMKMTHSTMPL